MTDGRRICMYLYNVQNLQKIKHFTISNAALQSQVKKKEKII